MGRVRRFAAIVLVTLLAAGPVYSAPPVSMLKASVSSAGGKPLAGVQMQVVSLDTGRAILAATTSDGLMAAELTPGLYTMNAVGGYEQVSGPRVVSLGESEVASPALVFRTLEQAPAATPPVVTVDMPDCLVENTFPQITAKVAPADNVVKTRLYFKGGLSPEVFYVEMVPGVGGYSGVLPKPTIKASPITIYVEVTGSEFGQTRSTESQATVVAKQVDCKGKAPAVVAAGPASAVSVATGVAGLPAGFAAAAAAGGAFLGLGTTTALVIGGALAAGAVIVAVRNNSSPSK